MSVRNFEIKTLYHGGEFVVMGLEMVEYYLKQKICLQNKI